MPDATPRDDAEGPSGPLAGLPLPVDDAPAAVEDLPVPADDVAVPVEVDVAAVTAATGEPPPLETVTPETRDAPEPPGVAIGKGTDAPFGLPGLPVNRAHPFYFGFVGAFGVLSALAIYGLLRSLAGVLTLVVTALFLALALDPLIRSLQRVGLTRMRAVALVFLGVIGIFVALLAAVVPPLVTQGTELAQQSPDLVRRLLNLRAVHDLDQQYGIVTKASDQLQSKLSDGGTVLNLFGGVFGAGRALVSGVFSAFTVLVLTLYFTASLRPMTEALYRLVPASRRTRVQLLSDEIMRRVGGYVAGQIAVATVNGVCTYVLVSILGLPYGLVLAITVGMFGLIPLVGATLGAVVVVLVAIFDSWQKGIAVGVYYLLYQQIENYLIAPRIMSRTVNVPGAVAVIAALAGGTLLGVLGALVAIPIAAGVLLIVEEVFIPRQERF